MYLTSFDGTNIWYQYEKKSDTTLIFIHGWASNWTAWEKEMGFLGKMGFSTIALDLRGHGQSDAPTEKNAYLLECFAKDIHEIVKKEKCKKVVLVGHSMGGMIALEYFKLFNEEKNIGALVLCDTTYKNVFDHKKIEKLSPFVMMILEHLNEHEEVKNTHFKHMKDIDFNNYKNALDQHIFYEGLCNTPMKSVLACLESMMKVDLSAILPEIDIPVLIIEGGEDKILPKLDSIEMYDEIQSAEIDFIPKGKHFVNLESPQEVDNYIWNFLKKHEINV